VVYEEVFWVTLYLAGETTDDNGRDNGGTCRNIDVGVWASPASLKRVRGGCPITLMG